MDDVLKTPLETWHFFAFLLTLAAFGAIGHVLRAVINPIPDRITNSDGIDLMISSGYNLNDHLFGTEYDEFGYYRLDSWRNFRLAIVLAMISGAIAYLITGKEIAHLFAWAANNSIGWFGELLMYRLENL